MDKIFLSTPSARRATAVLTTPSSFLEHFYPRPPRGGRQYVASCSSLPVYFYPRPPRGGRLINDVAQIEGNPFLSTPSARRATIRHRKCSPFPLISIHALREEGDQGGASTPSGAQDFYPRPPRGGRRVRRTYLWERNEISIHALREEGDANYPVFPLRCSYFYPRPPRGGRPFLALPDSRGHHISIHALREEGD